MENGIIRSYISGYLDGPTKIDGGEEKKNIKNTTNQRIFPMNKWLFGAVAVKNESISVKWLSRARVIVCGWIIRRWKAKEANNSTHIDSRYAVFWFDGDEFSIWRETLPSNWWCVHVPCPFTSYVSLSLYLSIHIAFVDYFVVFFLFGLYFDFNSNWAQIICMF